MVPQNDTVLDILYCQEQTFEDIGPDCCSLDEEETTENDKTPRKISSKTHYLQHDIFWEKTELDTLLLKEKRTRLSYNNVTNNGYLIEERKVAVGWILSVVDYYKFGGLTAVLAVNYFDRFTLSHRLDRHNDNNCSVNCNNKNNPWMSQLVAVACLSLAAKVEEIKVPLLLDLQVEESKYVFEAKTIQRMELLVLSTLGWRMHPTTPIDFFDHIARRLGLSIPLHWEFIKSCECLLVSLIADVRLVGCLPSVLATAVMLYVIKEVIKPHNSLEYQEQIMNLLEPSEVKLEECYKLIMELSGNNFHNLDYRVKHKLMSVPGSPSGVIDAYFNRDSSNDSWPAALSPSFSERLPKRSKVQIQPMRLPLLNRVSVDVLSSPH